MKRHVAFALVTGALGIAPALADPMPLHPELYTHSIRPPAPIRHATPQAARATYEPAPRQVARVSAAERDSDLGGGFIEFLFGGGRPVAPRPRTDGYERQAALHAPQLTDPSRQPIDPMFYKQTVTYNGPEKPGTIIIDTPQRFLFLVQDNGTAVRYGIGVGKPGFSWSGVKLITAKKEWPDWTPPPEMLQRRPDLPSWMAGGPENPLGARAMYLGSSLYRIHGSNEPWTIGQAVSSGCIRMRNEDVVDLYERVRVGTKVLVI